MGLDVSGCCLLLLLIVYSAIDHCSPDKCADESDCEVKEALMVRKARAAEIHSTTTISPNTTEIFSFTNATEINANLTTTTATNETDTTNATATVIPLLNVTLLMTNATTVENENATANSTATSATTYTLFTADTTKTAKEISGKTTHEKLMTTGATGSHTEETTSTSKPNTSAPSVPVLTNETCSRTSAPKDRINLTFQCPRPPGSDETVAKISCNFDILCNQTTGNGESKSIRQVICGSNDTHSKLRCEFTCAKEPPTTCDLIKAEEIAATTSSTAVDEGGISGWVIVLIILLVLAIVGIAGYFGYQWYRQRDTSTHYNVAYNANSGTVRRQQDVAMDDFPDRL